MKTQRRPATPRQGRQWPRQALWIGTRVLEGLVHAHARGLVHRDVKPANLILTREPQIKIVLQRGKRPLQLQAMAPEHQ